MSSLKMTFSLASLILIFTMAFLPTAVMAEVGGPTVMIDVIGTPARDNIDVKFTFDINVQTTGDDAFDDSGDATWQLYDKNGGLLGAATPISPTQDNSDTASPLVEADPRVWYANDIDVESAVTANPTAIGVLINVPADGTNGFTTDNQKGNQSNSKKIPLPPLLTEGSLTLSVAKADPQLTTTDGDDYVLTLAYKDKADAAAVPDPAPTVAHLTFDPSYLETAVVAGNTIAVKTTDPDVDGDYTLAIVLPTGAPPVTIGVQPSYIKGVKPITVPIPTPVTENDPAAMIAVSALDEVERTFRVEVTFTPAAKSDGSDGSAITGFGLMGLDVKDADDAKVLVTVEAERMDDNSYVAILKYDRLATLPLTIKVDQSAQKTSNPDHSAMVGMTDTNGDGNGDTNGDTNGDGNGDTNGEETNPPAASITVSNFMKSAGTFDVSVVLIPATGEDDVMGFNNTYLTIVDSSDDETPVNVTVAEGDDIEPPLMDDNLYEATLEYNTRYNDILTFPLVVTVNQDMLPTSNPTYSAEVGEAEPEVETPDTRAIATLAGPAGGDLLSAEFQISITFDKAATLTEDDIVITPATAGHVTAGSLKAVGDTGTMYIVRIQPFAGAESITVTVATNTMIKPAEMGGSITHAAHIATLASITAPAEFSGTTPFIAEFTFEAEEGKAISVSTSDISATNASVTDINRKTGSEGILEVQITPDGTADVVISLSAAGMAKFAYAGTAVTVKKPAVTLPPSDTISGTLNAAKTEATLSGTIGARGFATIGYMSLPNLAEFFRVGGTITLTDAGAAKTDHPAKTVVISEILWGLDLGEALNMQHKQQFIELYNTSADNIDLTGWKLAFSDSLTVPANDVDQVSNISSTGWVVDIGQSGRWKGTSHDGGTLIPINIVSMYRNIDYAKVEKVKDDGTADPNREEQLKGVPDGNAKGSWKASSRATRTAGIYESGGAKHSQKTFAPRTPTSIPRSPFVINEIGNDTGSDNDWVELHNISDAEASLKNYQLSVVKAHNDEVQLFHFHDKDYKVPSKGYIVVSSRHPNVTDLAAGKDVSIADDQEVNSGASHLFVVRSFNLPDSGKNLLILRNNHEGKHLKTAAHIVDVVGTLGITDDSKGTKLWPLVAITGAPHGNVIDGGDEELKAGLVYRRANTGGGTGEKHLAVVGYTGVGYDRAAENNAANGGTPGYENGAVKDKVASLAKGEITISEIMLDVGVGRQNLPQWVELHNSSMTQAVSLSGWKLHLENASPDANLNTFNATLSLGGTIIYPNQTVLIVTTTGRTSDPDHFPNNRVINIWTTKAHRDAVEMTRRSDQVISMKGFNLTLVDKDNKVVDEAGNLDGARRTRDEPAWVLPMGEDDDRRSSLLRVYDEGIAVDGTMEEAWVLADSTNLAFAISQTYYGDADDFGTPGFRAGGPLPVSLSKFRPERLATGEIVIRWITESELNNAGFNILRSETRNGEYTQLNTSLIAGQGTTSERTTYSWMDKSAKPNVVYYYQIQDVSLDGQVQTLRQSRLKGHVSPVGKLTTQWAEIKALQ